MANPKQIFRGIDFLPTIAQIIEEGFSIAKGQSDVLTEAHRRPNPVLAADDIERIIDQAKRSLENVTCTKNQLTRWQTLKSLSPEQRQQVDGLAARMPALTSAFESLKQLAEDYRPKTIEAFMAKTDEEIGVDAILRLLEGSTPSGPTKDPRLAIIGHFIDDHEHEADDTLYDLGHHAGGVWNTRAGRIRDETLRALNTADAFAATLSDLATSGANAEEARAALQRLDTVRKNLRTIANLADALSRNGKTLEALKAEHHPPGNLPATLHILADMRFTIGHLATLLNAAGTRVPQPVVDRAGALIADFEETIELHAAYLDYWKSLPLGEGQHGLLSDAYKQAAENKSLIPSLRRAITNAVQPDA